MYFQRQLSLVTAFHWVWGFVILVWRKLQNFVQISGNFVVHICTHVCTYICLCVRQCVSIYKREKCSAPRYSINSTSIYLCSFYILIKSSPSVALPTPQPWANAFLLPHGPCPCPDGKVDSSLGSLVSRPGPWSTEEDKVLVCYSDFCAALMRHKLLDL